MVCVQSVMSLYRQGHVSCNYKADIRDADGAYWGGSDGKDNNEWSEKCVWCG
jgi:hypothetical protein